MLNIALVDDHHLMRKSLKLLVNTFKGIEVLVEAENGLDLIEKLKSNSVDIVLLDIQMPVLNGYDTCTILHKTYPQIKILVVSQLNSNECIQRVINSGAHGFFSKTSNPEKLELAISSLNSNGYYFGSEIDDALRKKLLWNLNHPSDKKYKAVNFSPKELTVIKLACKELSSAEIAAKLNINIRTVDTYRENIMIKTGAKNFTGAVLFAVKHYYVTLD